jgi:hypothetical protein
MTSITGLARQLMTNYDQDRSGAIELSKTAETVRIDQRSDGGSWHYAKVTARRAFNAADQAGNRDGKVTEAELVALGNRYDTGTAFWLPHTKGDGQLEGLEALRAFGAVGEEILGVVGASGRQDGGGTLLSADQSGGALVSAGPTGGIVLGGNKHGFLGAIGDALKGAFAWRGGNQTGSGSWG